MGIQVASPSPTPLPHRHTGPAGPGSAHTHAPGACPGILIFATPFPKTFELPSPASVLEPELRPGLWPHAAILGLETLLLNLRDLRFITQPVQPPLQGSQRPPLLSLPFHRCYCPLLLVPSCSCHGYLWGSSFSSQLFSPDPQPTSSAHSCLCVNMWLFTFVLFP